MTSADPERLREFAQISGAVDGALSAGLTAPRNAWPGFTGPRSGARSGNASFLTGFPDLIHENQVESAWIRSIAEAFEQAGAGTLTDAELRLNWIILEDPAAAQLSMPAFTSAEKETITLCGWCLEQISIPKDDPMGLHTWTTGHTQAAADRGTRAGAFVGGAVGGAVGGIMGSGVGAAVGNFSVDLIKDPENTGATVVDTLTFWDCSP